MKNIKKVTLGFASCGSIDITERLGYIEIKDIETEIKALAVDGIFEKLVAKNVKFVLLERSDDEALYSETEALFQRIEELHDVTDITLYYDNGEKKIIFVDYSEEDDFGPNKNEMVKRAENGTLCVAIQRHKVKEKIENLFPKYLMTLSQDLFLSSEIVAVRKLRDLGYQVFVEKETTIISGNALTLRIHDRYVDIYKKNTLLVKILVSTLRKLCFLTFELDEYPNGVPVSVKKALHIAPTKWEKKKTNNGIMHILAGLNLEENLTGTLIYLEKEDKIKEPGFIEIYKRAEDNKQGQEPIAVLPTQILKELFWLVY